MRATYAPPPLQPWRIDTYSPVGPAGGWWLDPARQVWEYRSVNGKATNILVAEIVSAMPREALWPSLLRDMHLHGYHRKCHPIDCPLTSPRLGYQ